MRSLIRNTLVTGLALLAAAGCGVEFDSSAQLEGLRVMAVSKSQPYARPGESVDLRMLYHDDAPDSSDVAILWLGGCRNPPGDLYAVCVAGLRAAFDAAEPPPLPEDATDDTGALTAFALAEGSVLEEFGVTLGFGDTFQVTLEPSLIESHPPPQDPKRPDYGLEHVFFAACAGRLWFNPNADEFPIGCYDDEGEPVGADRFVVGYTTVFAYEELRNDNPVVEGMDVKQGSRWQSVDPPELCLGADCATSPADTGSDCTGDEPTLSLCEDPDDAADCAKLDLRVVVDEASAGVDELLTRSPDEPVSEQLWVNYHADRGKFTRNLKLINDVEAGFQKDVATSLIASDETGRAYVWAVVRDNHGGVDWARMAVCVE